MNAITLEQAILAEHQAHQQQVLNELYREVLLPDLERELEAMQLARSAQQRSPFKLARPQKRIRSVRQVMKLLGLSDA